MTDHDSMIAMLTKTGLVEIPYDENSNHSLPGNPRHFSRCPAANFDDGEQGLRIVDEGYNGFFTVMVFDSEGALVRVEAWE